MTYIIVDVETDGPCPGLYSMIELGAVAVDEVKLDVIGDFHTYLSPITDAYVPEALAVSCPGGRDACFKAPYGDPDFAMHTFRKWLDEFTDARFMFISDNNGFDWQFVNYYCWKFLGSNPFGHSSTNLGSLYKGYVRDMRKNFKHLRKTKHTHNALDDARGNAEALIEILKDFPELTPRRGTEEKAEVMKRKDLQDRVMWTVEAWPGGIDIPSMVGAVKESTKASEHEIRLAMEELVDRGKLHIDKWMYLRLGKRAPAKETP